MCTLLGSQMNYKSKSKVTWKGFKYENVDLMEWNEFDKLLDLNDKNHNHLIPYQRYNMIWYALCFSGTYIPNIKCFDVFNEIVIP